MKTLVTGGAGFIASHIVDALLDAGHEVVIVDNMANGRADNVNRQASMHHVDIADSDALNDVFAREKPDVVSHHAAQTSVRHSMAGPAFDARVNIIGSINVLILDETFRTTSRITTIGDTTMRPGPSLAAWCWALRLPRCRLVTRPSLFMRRRTITQMAHTTKLGPTRSPRGR